MFKLPSSACTLPLTALASDKLCSARSPRACCRSCLKMLPRISSVSSEPTRTGVRDRVRRSIGDPPFIYISSTPERRQRLENASSNTLWVLERTRCVLGGRPLRRSSAVSYRHKNILPQAFLASASSVDSPSDAAATDVDESYPISSETTFAGGGAMHRVSHGRVGDVLDVEETELPPASIGGTVPPLDSQAQAAVKQLRGMGAGEPVEYVRIKHLATLRYLSVSDDCGPGDDALLNEQRLHVQCGDTQRGDLRGASRAAAERTRHVGMITVGRYAPVPSSTIFVIRPRVRTKSGVTTAVDSGLSPEDLVHLQHKDTGFFLSALPRGDALQCGEKGWGRGSGGERVGLTVLKSPLTSEVRAVRMRTVASELPAQEPPMCCGGCQVLRALARLRVVRVIYRGQKLPKCSVLLLSVASMKSAISNLLHNALVQFSSSC